MGARAREPEGVYHPRAMHHRLRPALVALLVGLGTACAGPAGPGPQEATFPPGQRVARGPQVAVELLAARYDMRQVELRATIVNRGDEPLTVDRDGILLEVQALEYPVSRLASDAPQEHTVVGPGERAELRLAFVMEQALVQAGTLHLMSIRRGAEDQPWLEPLHLPVPPPAAFVEAAQPATDEP